MGQPGRLVRNLLPGFWISLALFLGNLKRYVAGRTLMNVVDTRLGY